MRHRHTVGGAQTAEIPALDAAGKTLTDRGAGDVDELADHEMICLDFGANRDQRVFRHAELGDLPLGLDLGHRKLAALCLRQIDGLAGARTELQRNVTVLLGRRWPSTWQLPSFSTVTGICSPVSVKTRVIPTFCAITPERIGALPVFCLLTSDDLKILELDLDVDTSGQVELHQSIDGLRGRVDNVEKALVGAHLELFAALLVDVR